MLTRLKVSGFKNLVDVDIRFGPFTCIAGPNAVGKSNLFDAIQFLSHLAKETLVDAAVRIRSEDGHTGDVRSLFHRLGETYADSMSFEAEMILPQEGIDDLGQKARATTTLVRYKVKVGYRERSELPSLGALELLSEELEHIKIGDAPKVLQFPHSSSHWRKSVLTGRRATPFISTASEGGNRVIKLSQDGTQGRPRTILANNSPRTVLSTVNASESPTALLARQEMRSWRLLQLEPAVLREPDRFTTWPGLQSNGGHLPATLYYLAQQSALSGSNDGELDSKNRTIYDQVALRLSELIDEVYQVDVDRDERRELFTLQLTERDGTHYPARSLSDGTLRFLALATIDLDPAMGGVLCLEEPENGIHPGRIPAIIRLLEDIACDVSEPVGADNPLRQVIINTHSPAVVQQVPDDSLLVALPKETVDGKDRYQSVGFGWLSDTWRCEADPVTEPVARGSLLAYLNPTEPDAAASDAPTRRRVIDRPDFQLALPFPD